MRPDIGLSTIATRIAGMRSIAAPPPAASAPASGNAFADALNGQLEAQTAAAEITYAQAQVAAGQPAFAQAGVGQAGLGPAGFGAAGLGTAQLGPGVQLTGGGQIAPQMPGVGAVGHSCPECQPAGVGGVTTIGLAGAGVPTGTRSGPPAELQAYGNGRIPASALQPLGVGDHSLWSPAASAFTDMAAAAARDGVQIGVNSSYRSYEQQVAMVERYGLYSQGGRAASPGSSNHGWGVSVDLQLDDQAQRWMRANAAAYGFAEDVAREPWHWTFTAAGY